MQIQNDKVLNENIDRLNISCNAIKTLKNYQIITINQICHEGKKKLEELGLTSEDINQAEVDLQLLGLNLK